MAWNGSSSNANAKPVTAKSARVPKKSSSILHGLLAGGIVVLIGIVALFFLKSEQDEPESKPKSPTTIAEATPDLDATPAPVAQKPKEPKPIQWVEGMKNVARNEDGSFYYVPRPGHQLVTNRVDHVNPATHIFKYPYQNEIAAYLTAVPGDMPVGERTYSDDFVKQVIETMSLPIEDDDNDTPEQRELRQQMREVMKTLQSEADAGRDVRILIQDTRKELQELGRYKQTLRSEVNKIYDDPNLSDQDIDDFVKAANKMLEAKGIAPLEFNNLSREVLKNSHAFE